MLQKIIALTIASLIGGFTSTGAFSQNVTTSDAIISALTPERTGPIVRSMTAQAKRGIAISGQLPPQVDLPKIALTVNFDLDSARLTNDGMIALRSLAKALLDDRLSGMTFQVAGHTDGRGDPAYNQRLSDRRARAVVDHLVGFYDVPRDRLVPIGYGFTQPANASNLLDPLNRRVEIINVQPLS